MSDTLDKTLTEIVRKVKDFNCKLAQDRQRYRPKLAPLTVTIEVQCPTLLKVLAHPRFKILSHLEPWFVACKALGESGVTWSETDEDLDVAVRKAFLRLQAEDASAKPAP